MAQLSIDKRSIERVKEVKWLQLIFRGGELLAFQFGDWMINEYLAEGYLVLRGVVPPSLLGDLRTEAVKARDLAHQLLGPQTQRIQPLADYADDLNLRPFYDYIELAELQDAIEKLLGKNYTHGHIDIMGLLVEPLEHPWHIGWHRDGVVEVPPEAYDEITQAKLSEVWHDLRHYNQVNCAIYAESCTWFVPRSHLRQWDLPGERQTTGNPILRGPMEGLSNLEAECYYLDHCLQFPGAVQVHLGVGDFMIYRNLGWHTGNYVTYQPRATIHDVVRYEGETSWTGWQQTKWEAMKRMKDETS